MALLLYQQRDRRLRRIAAQLAQKRRQQDDIAEIIEFTTRMFAHWGSDTLLRAAW